MMNKRRIALGIAVALAAASVLSGCLGAPEQCQGCLGALSDAGLSFPDAAVGTGGASGSGGNPGSGGMVGTGGAPATGGQGTGDSGTGGANTGGGSGTGGANTGGSATGGANTGGSATGGANTGGSATGGANTGGSATGGSATGGSGTDPDLVLWYKFDDANGPTAVDSAAAGGTARNATLATIGTGATASFSTTKQVGTHAANLVPAATAPNANGGYISLPSLQTLAPNAVTIAVWVNLAANTATQNWERIFDFGVGTGATVPNMYLTARAADATTTPVRFAISMAGHAGTAEQRLDGAAALTSNAWHHIAVVLPAGTTFTGALYIDGVSVATNNAMTLHPTNLGATTNNWLGRSQFSDAAGTNPCFNGLLDDFRVYRRALTAAEISTLHAVR